MPDDRLSAALEAQTEVLRELLELLRGQRPANQPRRRRRPTDPELVEVTELDRARATRILRKHGMR